ncbi:acyl-CoA thioester hydrolase/BAAT C-terminal domain-containing protein [Nocardioides zhouii]|uniref:Acyl-CoA thioesterase n=1 Tax=Nocardioides zhouii TaxID=1168729 RepID=A0A4Q2T3E4_9ACTN|nr:acyl-CoA thioester hydrolase/BAAT C-terminal domain-containing protein [Nocardioides zhouii]RYC13255.1 acyl-CoA thioesterase [Nocardioides zhouii]
MARLDLRRIDLTDVQGVRWAPADATGVGALVLAGSSGRVDSARAELLARHGVVAEAFRWFGGPGQHEGPWEIPLESFVRRIDELSRDCDRIVLLGTSLGSEAALLTGALDARVDTVVAFAPSDTVWAGVRKDGTMTSHWSLDGVPLPFVPFDDAWRAESDLPAFELYDASRRRFPDLVHAAAIPVERVRDVVLVAGGDDQVRPSLSMAGQIVDRREALGLSTTFVSDPEAGHRTILPGEPVVVGGVRMRRGGNEEADSRLGRAAWSTIVEML